MDYLTPWVFYLPSQSVPDLGLDPRGPQGLYLPVRLLLLYWRMIWLTFLANRDELWPNHQSTTEEDDDSDGEIRPPRRKRRFRPRKAVSSSSSSASYSVTRLDCSEMHAHFVKDIWIFLEGRLYESSGKHQSFPSISPPPFGCFNGRTGPKSRSWSFLTLLGLAQGLLVLIKKCT